MSNQADVVISRPLAEPSATLDKVREMLGEVAADIARGWHERSPEPTDVLARDLPELLRAGLIPSAGKQLRPVMCHWGWVSGHGAEGGRGHADLVCTAAALELLHLVALVHDDVMDRSDSRRGRLSTHVEAARDHAAAGAFGDPELFGDSVAVLLGDLALSESSHLIGSTCTAVREEWRLMLRELVQGQLLDLTGTAARRRDLELSRRVARLKSGAYTVQRPLLLGAAAAGASPAVAAALSSYGEHLGEAFALRDDNLGIWGDTGATGKPVGDDLVSGKATVVLALGQQRLPAPLARRLLAGEHPISPDEVCELQQALVDCGVRDEVEAMITRQSQLAMCALECTDLHPDGAAGLVAMVQLVAWRDT